jgi:hypothetical protein
LRRYAQRTGADLSQIDHFVALGCWKLACIAEGIAATGPGPDDHAEADRMTAKVTPLAEAALVALQRTV